MIGSHIRQKAWSLIPSLVPQMVKHLPAMWETGVRSLGQEDPFQYSCLENSMDWGAWQSMGSQRVRHDWVTSLSLCVICYFSLTALNSLSLTFVILFKCVLACSCWVNSVCNHWFMDFCDFFSSQISEVFSYYVFKYLLKLFLSLFFSRIPIMWILVCLMLSQFSSVQSLSHVWLFAIPGITAWQASLPITNFWSLTKLMSIESMMPSSHRILCHPLLLLPPVPPSIRIFSSESTLCMRWPKYWSFSFSISPSNEHPGLPSFRMDWLDLLAVQGTLKSLLQHHS